MNDSLKKQRLSDLRNHVKQDLKLLSEYQKLKLKTKDPREAANYEQEINDLQSTIGQWHSEIAELS